MRPQDCTYLLFLLSAALCATLPTNATSGEPKSAILQELGMEFVEIPAGSFEMGTSHKDDQRQSNPLHDVSLDAFHLSSTELTFDQYDYFCEATERKKPGDHGWGRGSRPVIGVSWTDAAMFCRWLSERSGYEIRLPTEAEWEYAARGGGRDIRYANGSNEADAKKMNVEGSSEKKTMPVGSLPPNALGLYEMSGNVWEWCSDWFDADYYTLGPDRNPHGPETGTHRVIRGGSWGFKPMPCAGRASYTPRAADLTDQVGFRIVRTEAVKGDER